jgi:hypothetical protein
MPGPPAPDVPGDIGRDGRDVRILKQFLHSPRNEALT